MSNFKILRPAQVAEMLNISLQTLWRYSRKNPDFPEKLNLGGRAVGYRSDEVEAYINSLSVSHSPNPNQN